MYGGFSSAKRITESGVRMLRGQLGSRSLERLEPVTKIVTKKYEGTNYLSLVKAVFFHIQHVN